MNKQWPEELAKSARGEWSRPEWALWSPRPRLTHAAGGDDSLRPTQGKLVSCPEARGGSGVTDTSYFGRQARRAWLCSPEVRDSGESPNPPIPGRFPWQPAPFHLQGLSKSCLININSGVTEVGEL